MLPARHDDDDDDDFKKTLGIPILNLFLIFLSFSDLHL